MSAPFPIPDALPPTDYLYVQVVPAALLDDEAALAALDRQSARMLTEDAALHGHHRVGPVRLVASEPMAFVDVDGQPTLVALALAGPGAEPAAYARVYAAPLPPITPVFTEEPT